VPSKLKIAILGVGPIGSLISSALLQSRFDHELFLIDQPYRIGQLAQHGLLIGDAQAVLFPREQLIDSLLQLEHHPVDILCFCTKAYSLNTILPLLKNKISRSTLLISIQNGIDPENLISASFPDNPVARMVVNFAGGLEGENGKVLLNWFHPPNVIGLVNPGPADHQLEILIEALSKGGLTTEKVPGVEMKKKAFYKAILNSALSPLCALTDLTMSQAMGPSCRPLVAQILEEGLAVAHKLGFDYGPQALTQCLGYLDKGGDHYPSMWHDLEANRLSEIDFINGRIVELGRRFGVNVPHNYLLTALMVSKEIQAKTRLSEDMPAYLKMSQ